MLTAMSKDDSPVACSLEKNRKSDVLTNKLDFVK